MADYRYSYNGPEEGTAKAMLRDIGISTKVSIEISNYLRGKSTAKAKRLLELVLEKKHAIPFKRFTDGVGHKSGPLDAGRYPQKASKAFLDLIKLAEANASHKGLADELQIIHLLTHKASTPYHYGRQSRRKMKRSHIEIVIKEVEGAKKKSTAKKVASQDNAQKTETTQKTSPSPVNKEESKKTQAADPKPIKTVKKTAAPEAEKAGAQNQ